VRKKEYNCLFSGCSKKAIRSHAIPRASCIEALADNGIFYTQRQSFNPTMNVATLFDAPDIVETGVNQRAYLRAIAPTTMPRFFHQLRRKRGAESTGCSLSLEFSRKRQNADFFGKLAELSDRAPSNSTWQELAKQYGAYSDAFCKILLGSVFNLILGSDIDSVEYFCVPFTRNLHVSRHSRFNNFL
jgi:hypothetical protein